VKQRKPLGTAPLKRTELKRGTSELKRTPMPRRSVGDVSSGGSTPPTRGPVKRRLESSEIPKAIRAAVLERDGYSCVRCGRYLVDGIRYGLQHRRPRGAGGSRLLHTMANLVTLCGWVGDAGTCTDEVEERARDRAAAEGWLLPKRIRTVTPEEWPVRRWTPDGPRWMQPGDEWAEAVPHEWQREMLGEAA
jgi:hypothetical protein